MVVWVAVAYAAYIAGLEFASLATGFGSRVVELDSRERWLSRVPFRKPRAEPTKAAPEDINTASQDSSER